MLFLITLFFVSCSCCTYCHYSNLTTKDKHGQIWFTFDDNMYVNAPSSIQTHVYVTCEDIVHVYISTQVNNIGDEITGDYCTTIHHTHDELKTMCYIVRKYRTSILRFSPTGRCQNIMLVGNVTGLSNVSQRWRSSH